jgi:hypothetical protein
MQGNKTNIPFIENIQNISVVKTRFKYTWCILHAFIAECLQKHCFFTSDLSYFIILHLIFKLFSDVLFWWFSARIRNK